MTFHSFKQRGFRWTMGLLCYIFGYLFVGSIMRVALGIEYDGSQYHGWQSQPGLHTIQACVENALSVVADSEIHVHCAGRTDTGVHATNQVIHFETEKERSIRAWIYGPNSNLPKDICVRWSKIVKDEFHARYTALYRRYRYIIYNNAIRPAVFRSSMTWHYRQLNHKLMHEGAQYLLGTQDFTSFRSVECQAKTPMRNISDISVKRYNDIVVIDITANAFLHHMVRNVAGVLINVGSGRKKADWVKEVLDAKDRKLGAETAPSYGLYLVNVGYPDSYELPKPSMGPMLLQAAQ
jgi:tRNA pseudouridine38-40 synthase